MAEQGQDRTEKPTAKKLRQARDQGQVARSAELPAAVIVIGSFMILMLMGSWLVHRLTNVFASGFVFDRKSLDKPLLLPSVFADQLLSSFALIIPLIIFTVVAAIVASGMTGGYHFSWEAVTPKGSKLNPINGLKRMFGPRALIELGKAILKFTLVAGVLWWSIMSNMATRFGKHSTASRTFSRHCKFN